MKTFVYCLKHPLTNEVRYIGRTNNLKRRFAEHLRHSRSANSHKKTWILQLLKSGLSPIMEVLEECEHKNAARVENYWISKFTNLVNHPGRDGTCGFTAGSRREEIRKEVIGKNLKTGEEIVLKGIYSSSHFSGDAISKCLSGACRQHKGFGWKFPESAMFSHQRQSMRSLGYGVIRIDLFTGDELYYEKVTIAESFGFSSSGIFRCASGACKQHKGFSWRWATQEDRFKFTGLSNKAAFQRNKKRK